MAEAFDAVDIIHAKRDRRELTPEQIAWTIDAYTRGVVAEEQMSALAMAIYLNGMNAREIARWADAMIRTGERLHVADRGNRRRERVRACRQPGAFPRRNGRGAGRRGRLAAAHQPLPGCGAERGGHHAGRLDHGGAVLPPA